MSKKYDYLIKTECLYDGNLILDWLKKLGDCEVCYLISQETVSGSNRFIPMFINVRTTDGTFPAWFRSNGRHGLHCGIQLFELIS